LAQATNRRSSTRASAGRPSHRGTHTMRGWLANSLGLAVHACGGPAQSTREVTQADVGNESGSTVAATVGGPLSAQLQPTVQPFYGEYSICVVKGNENKKLGVCVGYGDRAPRGHLVVKEMRACGPDELIPTWNQEHTDSQHQVLVGDHIIGINDVEGDERAMIHEIVVANTLVIHLVRLSPEQRNALRHDFFRSKAKALRSVFDRLPTVNPGASGMSECVVCQEDFDPQQLLTQLPCEHAFCTSCISRWMLQCKNECPLCARPITKENVLAGTTLVGEQQFRQQDASTLKFNFDVDCADVETHHGGSPRGNWKCFSVSRRDGFGGTPGRVASRGGEWVSQSVRTAVHI